MTIEDGGQHFEGVQARCADTGGFNARENVAAAALGYGIYRDAVSQGCCMNVLTVISPALKVLFERVGKPEVINRPDFSRLGGAGAVIACNHVGWADGLWVTYAVYPRPLRYMSKQELFSSSLSRWVLEHVGSMPIDRADPSPSSIKTAVDILQHGGVILIFPSGTRSDENIVFKRGAATVALHARVPLVPAFFQGPKQMQVAHLLHRPLIRVTFGSPIPTAGLPLGKRTTIELTRQLQAAIGELRSIRDCKRLAA
jgi:1-acyl-sn-glycerol-3-phosphate acyltransferase